MLLSLQAAAPRTLSGNKHLPEAIVILANDLVLTNNAD